MLNIQKTLEGGNAVYTLSGRLDTVTAPELEQDLQSTLPEAQTLTLDFAGLEYISSAGLRVLLSTQKAMSAKGGMTVKNVGDVVREVLDVTGFSDILTIA